MAKTRNVSDFFSNEIPNYAAYDNLRKISGYDGLKLSMRKLLYSLLMKHPGPEKIKTDTITNECAAFTNYVHGADNLAGVCNTMAQSFVGANNFPLLEGNSSGFGTRIDPTCAASRYTRIALSPITKALLDPIDFNIVEQQYFEGDFVEPKYFVPIFPLVFLNGSHGLSTGFSQDIYPRNPIDIINYIRAKLNNKQFEGELLPWFKGFKGEVRHNPTDSKLECCGTVVKNSSTSYTITEIPIGICYHKYIEILDKLCEQNIIVDYEDACDTITETICFNIKTTRAFTEKHSTNESVMACLKLIRPLSETLCCIDCNNRVEEFTSVESILDSFIDVRLTYYQLRKDYILSTTAEKLKTLTSKYTFCSNVINNNIIISNNKKADIIKQLEKYSDIIKLNDSFDYLLNMPLHSLSHETLDKLSKDIDKCKAEQNATMSMSPTDMWMNDLKEIEKIFIKLMGD